MFPPLAHGLWGALYRLTRPRGPQDRTSSGGTVRLVAALRLVLLGMLVSACGPGGGPTGPPSDTLINVEGTWLGQVTQPGGQIPDGFSYRLILRQRGTNVRGSARAETISGPQLYYAEWRVRGRVTDQGQLELEERRITVQLPPPGLDWCLKTATLQHFDGPPRTLVGDYSATPTGCLPGSMGLELQ